MASIAAGAEPGVFPELTEEKDSDGNVRMQRWPLPTDAKFIESFLMDIFQRYWDQVIFGPILQGIAYEMTCPCAPDRFELSNGYFTIGFGGPHFHLCVGPGAWPDTPEGRRNMPGSAFLFRMLDSDGAPSSWGFELRNGADAPMMSIWFASPFLTGPDQIADTPDWSRLSMWHDISARYLGLGPDPFDMSGKGFAKTAKATA